MIKIMLDAGHGGKDPGALGNGLKEKDLTLRVVLKIGKKLEKTGYYLVGYTRKIDEYLSLMERANIANKFNADAFISVHINAAENITAQGYETFSYPTSSRGARLSKDIHSEIIEAGIYTKNRGTKLANFAVLRETIMPAALLELAFITNKEDSQLLIDKEDEFVEAIVKGINKYFGIKGDRVDYKGHWAEKYIDNVMGEGVMIGDDNGNFRPNDIVTRAELAVVVSRLIERKEVKTPTTKQYRKDVLEIIETTPDKIYTQKINKSLSQVGANGVNGTLYDGNGSVMILINNGKVLGSNAYWNGWKQPPRPVIFYTKSGELKYEIVKSVNELSVEVDKIQWAVGGGSLPYNPSENWGSDVLRPTAERTALAIKDDKIYLIATTKGMSLTELGKQIQANLKPDRMIFLDGGGSTQMYFNKSIKNSSRAVDNGIFVKGV